MDELDIEALRLTNIAFYRDYEEEAASDQLAKALWGYYDYLCKDGIENGRQIRVLEQALKRGNVERLEAVQ